MSPRSLDSVVNEVRTLETWRHTNVAPLLGLRFVDEPAGPVSDVEKLLSGEGPRLVFINGRYAAELSRTAHDSVSLTMAREPLALGTPPPFAALNAQAAIETAVVRVPAGAAIGLPIEVVHVTDSRRGPALALPRTQIVLEAGARACVVERYLGLGDVRGETLQNAVTEIRVAEQAHLAHLKWNDPRSAHVAFTHATLAREACWKTCLFGLSGSIARSEVSVALGERAEVTLDALLLARGEELCDLTTLIDHRAPFGKSRQIVKGVLAGKGRSVFDGRIRVQKGAVKTDSGQSSKTLMLSNDASAVSKPHLEINTDDVKCAHGATSGQLSADALFYLRARGISEAEARAMLAHGFAREVIDRISDEALRTSAEAALVRWLGEVAR